MQRHKGAKEQSDSVSRERGSRGQGSVARGEIKKQSGRCKTTAKNAKLWSKKVKNGQKEPY